MTRPWSPNEVDEEMQAAAQALEDLAADAKPLGVEAARAKWRYRRAKAAALGAGAARGSNKETRDANTWMHYVVEPSASNPMGVTVADIGEAADMAINEFEAHKQAIYAVIEQGKIIQSLHVTGREATNQGAGR